MKKLAFLLGMVVMIFAGCTKDIPGMDPNLPQDVIFTNSTSGGSNLKSTPDVCSNPDADYAVVVITTMADGVDHTYYPDAFTVNGVLYTQAIKLMPGSYNVKSFALMHIVDVQDNLYVVSESDPTDTPDEMVQATPEAGSPLAAMWEHHMPVAFEVAPFQKYEVVVDVLCFEAENYKDFGFAWFAANQVPASQMWFFGDFCTKNFQAYAGSAYGDATKVKVDMPAIFKIEVLRNNVSMGSYSTADNLGAPKPLSVKYIDRPGILDEFELKLYVLVKTGQVFDYKYMESWRFSDNQQLVTRNGSGNGPGNDGVYDFILGDCNAEDADFAIAPYMNLPEEVILNLTLSTGTTQNPRKAYIDMFLTDLNNNYLLGYDFEFQDNNKLPGFCFNKQTNIYVGTPYDMMVYSTLNKNTLPLHLQPLRWDRVNWLVNHLENFPGYSWTDLQQALWMLENPAYNGLDGSQVAAITSVGLNMVNAAKTNGTGYVPLPGGWAAVAFVLKVDVLAQVQNPTIQTIFSIVDP